MYFIGMMSTFLLVNFILSNLGPILFYIIQLYSRIQLLIINPTLTKQLNENYYEPERFECFVDNRLIQYNTSENAIEKINESEITVLISKKHMVCFYPPIKEYDSIYEASSVRFISVKIEIDSVEYDIKMCSPTHSFYVSGNDLNVDWVRYYFLKFNKIVLSADVEYKMTVIDDDVNFIVLNQFECIELDRDNYNIYTYVGAVEDDGAVDGDVDDENNDGDGDVDDDDGDVDDENKETIDIVSVIDDVVYMIEIEEQMNVEMNEERNINHALKCILEDEEKEDEEIERIIAGYENVKE
jgi:hypothetical protein